jgi:hypothetical protein
MRVRNAHSADIDGHLPGATFDVDPEHPAWAPLLRAGTIVPATAGDVQFGANDPPPSAAAVRELIAGVNARNREIEELHGAVEALTTDRADARDVARGLQARVNELEAVLALRPGAATDEGAVSAAVRAAEETLTKRFDAAYAKLRDSHDDLARERIGLIDARDAALSDNAKLKADLDGLLSAAPAAAPSEPTKPTKKA